jgi:3-methylfumaryl-CoA hydratase
MQIDIDHLKGWVGRSTTSTDDVRGVPVEALAATLDWEEPASALRGPLPPFWHQVLFLPLHRQSEIGPDGHAKRGGFLPPVPLPRRMWAGGEVSFLEPIRIGDALTRTSRILDVQFKAGRSGPLVFVTVEHAIDRAGVVVLHERQDLVYREAAGPNDPAPTSRAAPTDHAFDMEIRPDDVLLFRYSALTFNGHRIHYDRRYVTQVEGYPGLIVHGPLIATLLLESLRLKMPGRRVSRFSFRSVRPLFDIAPFSVCGRPDASGTRVDLWAKNAEGWVAMEAQVELA